MLLIAVGFILILLTDLPALIRRKAWGGVAVLLLLFIPALALSVLLQLGIKIPSALLMLGQVFKSMGISY